MRRAIGNRQWAVRLMEHPPLLWRAVGLWTGSVTLLGFVLCWLFQQGSVAWGLLIGVCTLSAIAGYYALLAILLRRMWKQLFPLVFLAKYPLIMLVAYGVVQGGSLMVLGFVAGVVLPLAVLTAIAVVSLFQTRSQ